MTDLSISSKDVLEAPVPASVPDVVVEVSESVDFEAPVPEKAPEIALEVP